MAKKRMIGEGVAQRAVAVADIHHKLGVPHLVEFGVVDTPLAYIGCECLPVVLEDSLGQLVARE